jgi:hypothetical protein
MMLFVMIMLSATTMTVFTVTTVGIGGKMNFGMIA